MVRFPTVRITCVSYVPCSASVGAPGAASRVEFCMVGSAEAWMGLLATHRPAGRATQRQERHRAYLSWSAGRGGDVGALP